MKIKVLPSQIYPSEDISDCAALFSPKKSTALGDKDPKLQPAHPIEGRPDNVYAIGPFACDLCIHRCEEAWVTVGIEQIAKIGGFDLQDAPVTLGERLKPQNPTMLGNNDESDMGDTDAVVGITHTDSILDDIAILSGADDLGVSPDGTIEPIPPTENL